MENFTPYSALFGGALIGLGATVLLALNGRIAGFLVGFGTRLGGGCTSGHGVCGLARLSPRSIAAVTVFTISAGITVYLIRHGWGGA